MKPILATLLCLCALNGSAQDLYANKLKMLMQQQKAVAGGGVTDYTNNLIFDLDAQSITASDGTGVATWTSSEPNAYVFGGGGGAANPYFTNSVSLLNNKKGVTFLKASSQYVTKTSVSYTARNYTVIAVVLCYDGANSADEEILHFSNAGSQTIQFCANTGGNNIGWYDGSFHEPGANTTGAQILRWELNSTGTAGAMYRNGTKVGASLAYTQGAADTFLVGIYQNFASNPFNGVIARIRLYDGDIGAANALHAEEALGNFYGISIP